MIAILDYGSGNLRSAHRAFERSGEDVIITSDFETALSANGLVVPGVGAFAACMKGLLAVRGDEIVKQRAALNRATLGICIGMQILFSRGLEHGDHAGVGIWNGSVEKLDATILPHMGWNSVTPHAQSRLFRGVESESFYFVHSYGVTKSVGKIESTTDYQGTFIAAIEDGPITATQFHPEKSGDAGLHLIKNWVSTL